MNFLNFLTNLHSANESQSRISLLKSISELLYFNASEPTTDSSPSSESNSSKTYYCGALTEILALGSDDEIDSHTAKIALNPTLWKGNEATFPFINGLSRARAHLGAQEFLRTNEGHNLFLNTYLKVATSSQHSHQRTDNTNKILNFLFSLDSKILDTELNITNYNNRTRGALSNNYGFHRFNPNLFAANFYKYFKNSINLSEKISLNLESHKSLLNDHGNLCIVDDFNITENKQPLNQLENFKYLKDFILITLKLKEIDANSPGFINDLTVGELRSTLETFNDISNPSIIAYYETYRTDNSPNFNELVFVKLTQLLLEQDETTLISQIEAIDNVSFNNYVKQHTLGTIDEKQIFSFFTKEFYTKFLHIRQQRGSHEDASPDPITSNLIVLPEDFKVNLNICPPIQNSSDFRQSINWTFATQLENLGRSFPTLNSDSDYIPFGNGFGITFANSTLRNSIANYIESIDNERIVGLIFNEFTKATNKEKFEFISLTKRQSTVRKGFFIPVLFPIKYRDEDFNLKNGYSFSLVCLTSPFGEMTNKKRSRDSMFDFLQFYFDTEALYFTNKEEYLTKQKARIAELAEYSTKLMSNFNKYNSTQLNNLKSYLTKRKLKTEALKEKADTNLLDILSSEPNVNHVIKRKYDKVTTYYNKLQKTNKDQAAEIRTKADSVEDNLNNIAHLSNLIKREKERLKRMEATIAELLTELKQDFNSRIDTATTLIANKDLYDNIKTRYKSAFKKAIENKDYKTNNFFTNMLETNHVNIYQINVTDSRGASQEIFSSKKTNDELFDTFNFKQQKYKIKAVKFLIDAPVIINVDGGDKGQVCAGPYVISINNSVLQIALAYPSSIHGQDNEKFYIHPHAPAINGSVQFVDSFSSSSRNNFYFVNGCLGEASALMYRAFEKNDLKLILFAALTWVKSANSTDTWGRNYKYFPKPSDLNSLDIKEASTENSISEDDIHEFLEEMVIEGGISETPVELTSPTFDRADTEITPPQNEIEPQAEPNSRGEFTPEQFTQPANDYIPIYNTPSN